MEIPDFDATARLIAAAALVGALALPAFGAGFPKLNDGRLHGFQGCLTQENVPTHYFDLQNAKSDDGTALGTVRLTSNLAGIATPQEALNHEVRINGSYRGHAPMDPGAGHVAVKDAAVVAATCS